MIMKKNLISAIYIVATLLIVSCAGKTEGPASEVLSKKVYKTVIEEYETVGNFCDGVSIASKGNYEYIIDTKGKVILSVDCDKEFFLEEEFSHGLMPVLKESGFKSVVGYIDTKGNEVIPFEYQYGTAFYEGCALVLKNNKVYKINTEGEVIEQERSTDTILDLLEDADMFIEISDDLIIDLVGEEVLEELLEEDIWEEEW